MRFLALFLTINRLYSKVSGVGADSIFMGVMRRYDVEAGLIRVWVMPSGAVVCVDERFTDSEWLTYGLSRYRCCGIKNQTNTI